jgi:hypothetical protein
VVAAALALRVFKGSKNVIARSEALLQSRKIIKKILQIRIFYWIASSKLAVFPRNDGKINPRNKS